MKIEGNGFQSTERGSGPFGVTVAALASGFSLLELWVVIATIAVLAALLIPAISRAPVKARETRCANQLAQINLGIQMYLNDNAGRYPVGFIWRGRAWSPNDFIGGASGRDSNVPPAQVRPLFRYIGSDNVFRCPADVGIDATNQFGLLMKPSLFDLAGLSYWFNGGHLKPGRPDTTDGLGGRTLDWVKKPSQYVTLFEPPARGGSQRITYWHRARRPGTWPRYEDDLRGPRVSPFLFVDGHVKFIDCSGNYSGVLPGEIDN